MHESAALMTYRSVKSRSPPWMHSTLHCPSSVLGDLNCAGFHRTKSSIQPPSNRRVAQFVTWLDHLIAAVIQLLFKLGDRMPYILGPFHTGGILWQHSLYFFLLSKLSSQNYVRLKKVFGFFSWVIMIYLTMSMWPWTRTVPYCDLRASDWSISSTTNQCFIMPMETRILQNYKFNCLKNRNKNETQAHNCTVMYLDWIWNTTSCGHCISTYTNLSHFVLFTCPHLEIKKIKRHTYAKSTPSKFD